MTVEDMPEGLMADMARFAIEMPDIDYSNPMNPVPIDAIAAVRGALGSVSGVKTTSVSMKGMDAQVMTIVIQGECWSPSLHATDFRIVRDIDMSAGHTGIADRLVAAVQDMVAVQRRRLADGVAIGLFEPIEAPPLSVMTRHMVIDRALVRIAAGEGDDPLVEVEAALSLLHRQTRDYDGIDATMLDSNCSVHEMACGRVACLRTYIGKSDVERGSTFRAAFDGLIVSIPKAQIPETVAIHLPGRRLGDVADVHALINGRTIIGMAQWDETLDIMIEPDLIRVSTIADELARHADADF